MQSDQWRSLYKCSVKQVALFNDGVIMCILTSIVRLTISCPTYDTWTECRGSPNWSIVTSLNTQTKLTAPNECLVLSACTGNATDMSSTWQKGPLSHNRLHNKYQCLNKLSLPHTNTCNGPCIPMEISNNVKKKLQTFLKLFTGLEKLKSCP